MNSIIKIRIICLQVFLLTVALHAQPYKIVGTGVTVCYDTMTVIPCPVNEIESCALTERWPVAGCDKSAIIGFCCEEVCNGMMINVGVTASRVCLARAEGAPSEQSPRHFQTFPQPIINRANSH